MTFREDNAKNPYSDGRGVSGLPGSGVPGSGLPGAGLPGGGLPGAGMAPSYIPGSPASRWNQPPAPPLKTRAKNNFGRGITFAIGYVVVIWAVHIVNVLTLGAAGQLGGIHPWDPMSLLTIFTAPLFHVNLGHLMGNTVPGAIFAFFIGLSGARVFWEVTIFSVIVSGLGVWFFGGVGTTHLGASGMIYGWLAYLIVRGLFNRSGGQIVLGLVLGFIYSGLIWGVFPITYGVSWQAHLFGAIGGFLAGMLITSDDPPALKAARERKKLEKLRRQQLGR